MNEKTKKLPTVVGIKFSPIGKNYYFDATKVQNLEIGNYLIVQTSRGWQVGQLVEFVENEHQRKNSHYKPVDRLATEKDILRKNELDGKGKKTLAEAQQLARELNIKEIKLVTAEYSFDEKMVSFLYTTESEKPINFRKLSQKLKENNPDKKFDFHKIGPRDVAKLIPGIGACGMESRCCVQFLGDFHSISIRMAKTQGISLTPSDITGVCDRLRCCLNYEYCQYVDALKHLPKRNKKVMTPLGEGKVRDLAPLNNTVFVLLDDGGLKEFSSEEIQPLKQSSQKNSRRRSSRKK